MARSPRSPVRSRSNPPTDRQKPLSPCLVHRFPSSPIGGPSPQTASRKRRPSLPLPTTDSFGKPLETVPLRDCCLACVPITEESLKEGDQWKEKFSRGARRKRSASCSSDDFSISPPTSGFAAVKQGCCDTAVVSSHAVAIKVDEVDRKRKSPEPRQTADADEEPAEVQEIIVNPLPVSQPPRASPIQEEDDDDQLFPLPSPRRTPTPSSSPAGSESPSPLPSPNPSSTALVRGASSSRESLNGSSSDENILTSSLARKAGGARCEKGLLMPDSFPTSGSPTTASHFNNQNHLRAASSPASSPSTQEFSANVHERFASSPMPQSNVHTEVPSRTASTRQPSQSPTRKPQKSVVKKRSQGFSPTMFFKEALRGVSSMGNGGPSAGFSV
jgi:hypothetical protein